jgi:hypothetical protein
MVEVKIENKEEYLKREYPFGDLPNLTDQVRCIHCDEIIVVGNFKVFQDEMGEEYICCPNSPDCNGTIIDWISPD